MRRVRWLATMRHIALSTYAEGPCNGTIEMRELPVVAAPRLSLPILGASQQAAPTAEWVCGRCGKRWLREPLPDEAL